MAIDEKHQAKYPAGAKMIRLFRRIHRITAIYLFAAFFIMAVTGLLLGWKKNSGGVILAKTETGTTTDLGTWLPLDSLTQAAVNHLRDSVSSALSPEIDRIEVRPDKGVVKITFAKHYIGLQVDGATGKILRVEQRYSDLIEHLHDATILDRLTGTKGGIWKLTYTTLMGLALITFIVTGFWLWRGPKRLARKRKGVICDRETG